jgi:glycosyltransferase involved in cell wall biosynthesis
VVVINDASSDGSGEVYRKYFAYHRIDKKHYTYIENTRRVTALHNIYLASIHHCSKDSIVITIDADDEFVGRNVLNVFNWGYRTKKSGVIYTNFYWFQQPQTLMYGFTSEYSQN